VQKKKNFVGERAIGQRGQGKRNVLDIAKSAWSGRTERKVDWKSGTYGGVEQKGGKYLGKKVQEKPAANAEGM